MTAVPVPGPRRDFAGYGPHPPDVRWPDGSLIAVNLVVNYEEGGEYELGTDGVNDTWGESSYLYGPGIRDLGTEGHMEYGSRVGIWRLCRMFDRYGLDVTFSACARALERNPPLCDWLRARRHDILGHASAVRDFIEYALECEGVGFVRRIDVAEHWLAAFPPAG